MMYTGDFQKEVRNTLNSWSEGWQGRKNDQALLSTIVNGGCFFDQIGVNDLSCNRHEKNVVLCLALFFCL